MASIDTSIFSGIIPRLSPSLLPANHATQAENCDFAYGELHSTKSDFLFQNLINAAASIYTDDGLVFYSWAEDVDAARSPLASDPFDRLYYTTPSDFRVTTRSGMRTGGGPPGSSYRVGVPRPTKAPVLTLPSAEVPADALVTAVFHYEYSGVKYMERTVALTTRIAGKQWSFTAPAKTSVTPTQAFAVLKLTATQPVSNEQIFSVYSLNSGFASSDGLWTLTLSGDQADIDGSSSSTYRADLTVNTATANQQTTAYVYTYVNTYNEEGPPSPPNAVTGAVDLGTIVQVTRDAATADYAPIKEIRLYRTGTGTTIASYFYAATISVLTQPGTLFSVTDKTTPADLAEPLSSENYYPPDRALVNLTLLPNGILCGRKGNELHFCEAYKPWAWPPEYIKTYKHALVGIIAQGSAALVTTNTGSFFISGVAPSQMSESETGIEQGGMTKWSMAKVGGMICYASNDGLVMVDGGRANMQASERFFTRDVWRARYRAGFSSMRFAVWDGRLVVYSSARAFRPFMIRFDEAAGSMTDLPDFTASCSFTSPLADQCYVVRDNVLYEFAGGAEVLAKWTSREVVTPRPVNFSIAKVFCVGNWVLQFFAQDETGVYQMRHSEGVSGDTTFRLPDGYLSDHWIISVVGSGRMRRIRMSESASELRSA